ncbi:hypothetical protein DW683_17850 [Bacteroides sp. AM25-34]|nr:hypothetical protein DW683_17850 [Bacteroides sp. AM25-34]
MQNPKGNQYRAEYLFHRHTEFREPSPRRLCICGQDRNRSPSGDCRSLLLSQSPHRFGKVSVFSDLNNLKDIFMRRDYIDICGITGGELTAVLRMTCMGWPKRRA